MGEGKDAGGWEGAPFALMKSLQRIQCHKSFGTATQNCKGRRMDGIFQTHDLASLFKTVFDRIHQNRPEITA